MDPNCQELIMQSGHGRYCGIAVALAAAGIAQLVIAQDPPAKPARQPRQLAPGVLTVIPKSAEGGDVYTGPVPLPEIVVGIPNLDWMPNFEPKSQTLLEQAKRVTFFRNIWCLEFAFKPMRLIDVDIPLTSGQVQRKRIWYMVYRVRNVGYDVSPVLQEEVPGLKTAAIQEVNYATRYFFPQFVLESHEFKQQYPDQIILAAKEPIAEREKPGVELYNSIEMTTVKIPLSDERVDHSVWGYATWEDIDPRIDFFSVYVRNLTNAFQFVDPPGAYKPGDPPGTGRKFVSKMLELNFWRPGDTEFAHEREYRFGLPIDLNDERQRAYLSKYGLEQRLDYRWIYR
jgi:hypothetical protein